MTNTHICAPKLHRYSAWGCFDGTLRNMYGALQYMYTHERDTCTFKGISMYMYSTDQMQGITYSRRQKNVSVWN